MRKIQVLLPEEMIAYLQSIVESGETESMSQTIRKIILKEMKANETQ
jgi:Arc/MetJ-type ribon-helix-helix transcriptional regulator